MRILRKRRGDVSFCDARRVCLITFTKEGVATSEDNAGGADWSGRRCPVTTRGRRADQASGVSKPDPCVSLRNPDFRWYACVGVFGLRWIFFARSRSFWLSLGLLVVSGMVDNVSVVVRSTLLQLRTPEHLLGRVSAANQIFIGSSNEIGAFESGVAARLLGAVNAVVLGGLVTLGVVGVTAWKFPALRELDELT